MQRPDLPLYTVPGVQREDCIVFQFDGEEVSIDNEHAELVWTALGISNGQRAYDDVIAQMVERGINEETAESVFDDLASLKIITDGLERYKEFHKETLNPSGSTPRLSAEEIMEITGRPYSASEDYNIEIPLSKPNTRLLDLLVERKSTRAFENSPVEIEKLSAILQSCYSFGIKPTPSAGGLYSSRVNMLVKPGSEIPTGSYEYDPENDSVLLTNPGYKQKKAEYALNESEALHNAPIVIVLSADLSRHTEKYGNRGYRYSILEIGHMAQNIHLAAVEQGLTTLEYGGFNEKGVAEMIDADERYEPIIVVALGYENHEQKKSDYETLIELEQAYVGDEGPIESVGLYFDEQDSSDYYNAQAKFKKPNEAYSDYESLRYASGTATSMHLAQIKAVAEAYERYTSGKIRTERLSSALNLDEPYVTSQQLRPLSDEQYAMFNGLQRHNDEAKVEWVSGVRDNKRVWVPVDSVFYPLNNEMLDRKLTALADSSGVAAHTSREVAEKNAVLELVERDALMRAWFTQQTPEKLSNELIPTHVLDSAQELEDVGYKVYFLNMDAHFPTVQVVIVNGKNEYPYFSNGAACNEDIEISINKAFEEAHLGLMHAIKSEKHEPIKDIKHISRPSEHGVFYLHPENARHIEWLWGSDGASVPRDYPTYEDLVRQIQPIIVELNPQGEPLHVVRAIAPELVPINFGVGNEYYTHFNSGVDTKPAHIGQVPHFFA